MHVYVWGGGEVRALPCAAAAVASARAHARGRTYTHTVLHVNVAQRGVSWCAVPAEPQAERPSRHGRDWTCVKYGRRFINYARVSMKFGWEEPRREHVDDAQQCRRALTNEVVGERSTSLSASKTLHAWLKSFCLQETSRRRVRCSARQSWNTCLVPGSCTIIIQREICESSQSSPKKKS